jgi:phytoene synthase
LPSTPSADLADTLSASARLALAYAPRTAKPAWLAFLALDARLERLVREVREPLMAQIRLAWWRERLAEPVASWPKGEPLLDALCQWREPVCLARLPDAWEPLLAGNLTEVLVDDVIAARVDACQCLARELGQAERVDATEQAARIWAFAEVAAHMADGAERRDWCQRARGLARPPRLPPELRPLAVQAALGAASLARGGGPLLSGPGSVFLALRTGLAGR